MYIYLIQVLKGRCLPPGLTAGQEKVKSTFCSIIKSNNKEFRVHPTNNNNNHRFTSLQ